MRQKLKSEAKCRLKKGDEVIVTTGKSRGETGKIDRVDYKAGRVYVTGVNVYKKHSRPTSEYDPGGIIDKVMPMDWSNVQLLDPKKNKPTRIGYRVEDGKKFRFAKASGTVLD